MPVGNGSGHNVEYEVEPSDPGGNFTGDTQIAMYSMAAGAVSVGVGCLTHIGGSALVYLGLGLLAVALVFQFRALRRVSAIAQKVAPVVAAIQGAGSGRIALADGQVHAHTFVPGTWVVFYDAKAPGDPLASTPPIFDSNATAVLRQCGTNSTLAGQSLSRATGGFYVEV